MKTPVFMKIEHSFTVPGYTVLCFNEALPAGWRSLFVDGKEYVPEVVYGIPNAIGVKGEVGNIVGKSVRFTS